MQLLVGRVPIARAPDKGHKRPRNSQVRFGIGHRRPRKDIIPPPPYEAQWDRGGRGGGGPCHPATRMPNVNIALDQRPYRPHPATPTSHDQPTVGLLPWEANAVRTHP